jgi:serine/threonine protein kinase
MHRDLKPANIMLTLDNQVTWIDLVIFSRICLHFLNCI